MLPHWLPRPTSAWQSPATVAPSNMAGTVDARAASSRRIASFEQRLTALEARGAGIWGGADFAAAKARAGEAAGAREDQHRRARRQRLAEARQAPGRRRAGAPAALVSELAAGDRALAAGSASCAGQSYDLALRIDPQDVRALAGQARARELTGVLPLLADAQNAAGSADYRRVIDDCNQARKIDPQERRRPGRPRRRTPPTAMTRTPRRPARASQRSAPADSTRRAPRSSGAAALRPNGAEAVDGAQARGGRAAHARFRVTARAGRGPEADERWDDALAAYNGALRQDPSLEFAQEGKQRAAARAELNDELQALIERPDRLASPEVRAQASDPPAERRAATPGPVLRLQIARVAALLPEFEKPVHVSLVSDSLTQVAIPGIGTFGSFSRRDVELKPGRYTVIGTREGYRDVRREITVSPATDPDDQRQLLRTARDGGAATCRTARRPAPKLRCQNNTVDQGGRCGDGGRGR